MTSHGLSGTGFPGEEWKPGGTLLRVHQKVSQAVGSVPLLWNCILTLAPDLLDGTGSWGLGSGSLLIWCQLLSCSSSLFCGFPNCSFLILQGPHLCVPWRWGALWPL